MSYGQGRSRYLGRPFISIHAFDCKKQKTVEGFSQSSASSRTNESLNSKIHTHKVQIETRLGQKEMPKYEFSFSLAIMAMSVTMTVAVQTLPPNPSYPSCSVCGSAQKVIALAANVTIPTVGILNCSYLEFLGQAGYISPSTCPLIPVLMGPCDCAASNSSSARPAHASLSSYPSVAPVVARASPIGRTSIAPISSYPSVAPLPYTSRSTVIIDVVVGVTIIFFGFLIFWRKISLQDRARKEQQSPAVPPLVYLTAADLITPSPETKRQASTISLKEFEEPPFVFLGSASYLVSMQPPEQAITAVVHPISASDDTAHHHHHMPV